MGCSSDGNNEESLSLTEVSRSDERYAGLVGGAYQVPLRFFFFSAAINSSIWCIRSSQRESEKTGSG